MNFMKIKLKGLISWIDLLNFLDEFLLEKKNNLFQLYFNFTDSFLELLKGFFIHACIWLASSQESISLFR